MAVKVPYHCQAQAITPVSAACFVRNVPLWVTMWAASWYDKDLDFFQGAGNLLAGGIVCRVNWSLGIHSTPLFPVATDPWDDHAELVHHVCHARPHVP